MKKYLLLPAFVVCMAMVAQAQDKKLPRPPSPPKPPAVEKVEFTPPTIVKDNEVSLTPPPPPPPPTPPNPPAELVKEKTSGPKIEVVKFTAPKIVKDEEVNVGIKPPVTTKPKAKKITSPRIAEDSHR